MTDGRVGEHDPGSVPPGVAVETPAPLSENDREVQEKLEHLGDRLGDKGGDQGGDQERTPG